MKNLKVLLMSLVAVAVITSCSGDKKSGDAPAGTEATAENGAEAGVEEGNYDPKRGLGKWNAENVKLDDLTPAMADAGKKIFDVKCSACHKLTDEKLVGPGWKGITKKHEPYWILNFISDPDPMINVDPELQKQLEVCMVRMPNQNLTDQDSKDILAFMKQNDAN